MIKLSSSGFTLFEIIVAMFVISIAVIPMMQSFGPTMMTAGAVEKTAVLTNQARATMERLLALDFDTLKLKLAEVQPLSGNAVFGDSDETFTFEAGTYSPAITISDASGDASKTLLDLTVSLAGMNFSTRKADY
ncbi:MAG: prepilin-type N-terminal cleavage/methylation domain-containing protein [Deltaproteobacteria bacterium]|uniref:type IV pilus modification PilV family protein n=1 Tax=Desulfobacula sp. TaxID=2593537 RepID=UPI0019C60C69|nr:prepilin-type N-terminal cleavage/methylation domain-containing protein [Candidatus Desulfobacula maris]MBL6993205.1 prepilin-type N-terminal cleavage/methylation domain-containing protein [Desulfobacula sp.]